MPVQFTLPILGKSTGGAADPGNVSNLTEEDLRAYGVEMSSNQIPKELQFSRMGGWARREE